MAGFRRPPIQETGKSTRKGMTSKICIPWRNSLMIRIDALDFA
jgi:hypothetical protein